MKKLIVSMLTISGLLLALSTNAVADDKEIKGEGQCAKCSLKTKGVEKCQNAIVVKEDGKEVTYFLVDKEGSDVSKKFHSNICQGKKEVKAKGTVKEKDGKKELTVASIELVK